MSKFNKEVGLRIKNLRIKSNNTQESLALSVGWSRSHISNIESGRDRLSIDFLYQLAFFFKCDIFDIIPLKKDVSSSDFT